MNCYRYLVSQDVSVRNYALQWLLVGMVHACTHLRYRMTSSRLQAVTVAGYESWQQMTVLYASNGVEMSR